MSGVTVSCPGCGERLVVSLGGRLVETRREGSDTVMLRIGSAPHECPASKEADS